VREAVLQIGASIDRSCESFLAGHQEERRHDCYKTTRTGIFSYQSRLQSSEKEDWIGISGPGSFQGLILVLHLLRCMTGVLNANVSRLANVCGGLQFNC